VTDRFFDVPRTTHATSAGPVELPILYHDVTSVLALFHGSAAGARTLLAGTGLEPGLVRGERAVVAMAFYDYRRTSAGPYLEVGTAIFVVRAGERPSRLGMLDLLRPPARRRLGAYVVDLPVTTALACAAGRELWGYPKFVTGITLRCAGRDLDSAVLDPDATGATICRLAGRLGGGVPAPPLSLMTYSRRGDQLLRTHVTVRGRMVAHRPGSAVLEVGASSHRMAANLHTLGLAGARPFTVVTTDRFQSRLDAGVPWPAG
jgi:hypothetical protein